MKNMFHALADETRLKILGAIKDCSCECYSDDCASEDCSCMKDISEKVGITAPTASHHINELINAGFVTTSKKGRHVYCHINQKKIDEACSLLQNFCSC